MEWTVTIVTIVVGVVTIIWFIRDVRKENSKILKSILDSQNSIAEIQKSALEVAKKQSEILERVCQILERIEIGQRTGFETLAKILAKIEENTRK